MTGLPSDDRHPAPDAAEDKVHKDRRLLTGDSPLASNNPGKLAAKTLLRRRGAMNGANADEPFSAALAASRPDAVYRKSDNENNDAIT